MKESTPTQKRLRELLPDAQYFPVACDPVVSAAVSDDPSDVSDGGLYVHLDECDAEGAERAAQRGVSAVISERLLPGVDAPQAVVEDARIAHRLLSEALVEAPLDRTPLVTSGGSDGQDAISRLVALMANRTGAMAGWFDRLACDDGEEQIEHQVPSPHSKDWQRWLARCSAGGAAVAISAVDAQRVLPTSWNRAPSIACLVNLRADGLDVQGRRRWESPAEHRQQIKHSLGLLHPDTTLVVNADDADCAALAASHPGPLCTFGFRGTADVRGTLVEECPGAQTILIQHGRQSVAADIPHTGAMRRNECLAAAAVGLAMGVDLTTVARSLELSAPTPGRMESIVCGQPFSVFLDHAMRPNRLRGAMADASPAGGGRLVVSLRLSDDPGVALEQLSVAECMADRVIAHGGSLQSEIASKKTTLLDDALPALALAVGLAEEYDSVLVAGSFDPAEDRALLEDLLRHRLGCEERLGTA